MLHATAESAVTPWVLDTLMARWSALPDHRPVLVETVDVEPVAQARGVLMKTMERYLQYLSAEDLALYWRLLGTHHAKDWHEQLFDCFDLVCRTRGITIAVLRLHDLYRLLQARHPAEGPASIIQPIPAAV